MVRRDLTELIESAAPAPRAALDVGDIVWRAHRLRRRRRAIAAGASVAAAAFVVALATQVLPDRHERELVAAGPASPRPIPLEFGSGTVTARLALLDGTEIALTLPDPVGSGIRAATVADVELHGSVYADAGRGWRVDVSVGSVEKMLPDAERLPVPPTTTATGAVVDRPGSRLGLQFGPWALVASGDSLSDADINTLVEGVALAETAEGFVEYRGSLRLWVVDSPDLVVRGQGGAVSVFLRQCTAPLPTSPTAAGLDIARLDDPRRGTSLTLLCDRAQRIEVGIDAAKHLSGGDADQVDVEVIRTGSTLSAVQGATSMVASPGSVPSGGGALASPACGEFGRSSSPPEFQPASGTYASFVKGMRSGLMTFDVIQWLVGEDARKAYEQDEPSSDGSGPPNDYWIRNVSTEERSAEVDPDAQVELVRLRQDGSADTSAGTVQELEQYVAEQRSSVYWLGFKDGVINRVCEQYRP